MYMNIKYFKINLFIYFFVTANINIKFQFPKYAWRKNATQKRTILNEKPRNANPTAKKSKSIKNVEWMDGKKCHKMCIAITVWHIVAHPQPHVPTDGYIVANNAKNKQCNSHGSAPLMCCITSMTQPEHTTVQCCHLLDNYPWFDIF